MFKKIAIIAILMTIFISGTLFAQSIDVVVHNVQRGGPDVLLSIGELPGDRPQPYGSVPAPGGTGYTTVTFENIFTDEHHLITTLEAEQGSRSVTEGGGFSPFTTVHLYLPNSGDRKTWPIDPGPLPE